MSDGMYCGCVVGPTSVVPSQSCPLHGWRKTSPPGTPTDRPPDHEHDRDAVGGDCLTCYTHGAASRSEQSARAWSCFCGEATLYGDRNRGWYDADTNRIHLPRECGVGFWPSRPTGEDSGNGPQAQAAEEARQEMLRENVERGLEREAAGPPAQFPQEGVAKFRDPAYPDRWWVTDFTMEQIERRLAAAEPGQSGSRRPAWLDLLDLVNLLCEAAVVEDKGGGRVGFICPTAFEAPVRAAIRLRAELGRSTSGRKEDDDG